MSARRPVPASLQEYARGVGGGLLVSLPLFYTMEVWAVGMSAGPGRLAAFVAGTFALLVAYNQFAGIHAEHTLRDGVLESVEEMGLGLLVAAGGLALLGRFESGLASPESLGLLTVMGAVAALGVSVGTAQLGETPGGECAPRTLAGEVAVAVCGAVLIAVNVAPTEEVLLLGTEATPGQLAGFVAVSLALGAGLLHAAEARGSARVARDGWGGRRLPALVGATVTYAVALVVSGALLWVFGHVEAAGGGGAGVRGSLGPLVVLSLPAMLGASAGRLLLGSSDG